MKLLDRRNVASASIVLAAAIVVPAHGQVTLTEWTAPAGLTATHAPDEVTISGIQEWMTGGLAVGDFDRNGFPDLFYVGGGGQPDRLFMNDGVQGAIGFTDQAAAWGLRDLHAGNGVSVADCDGDGWQDIYVTSFGAAGAPGEPGRHRLYRNDGRGGFADIAIAAGVNTSSGSIDAGYGSAWGDHDLDGDLDLFVTSYWSTSNGHRLLSNDGAGSFTDVTGTALGSAIAGVWAFQPCFTDMDGDLWPELLITGDFETSRYLVNDGDGTFTDATAASGTGLDENGMGQAVGDVDNDGVLDWYVTSIHIANPPPSHMNGNMLYLSQRPHDFDESSVPTGTNDGGWGWGTIAADLDNDGRLDLVAVNGRPAAGSEWIDERAKLFYNQGGAVPVFDEIAQAAGLDSTGEGRGIVFLDADRDGDLDIAISNNSGALQFFRNDTVPAGNWLQLELDASTNPLLAPDGFGARIVVTAGRQSQVRFMNGNPSYLATSELIAHVGLGGAAIVDEIAIHWPRGQVTLLQDVAVNQRLTVMAPAPGDLDADGTVGVTDLLDLLSLWGPAGPATDLRADLDGDGSTGVVDLLALLSAWGSGSS